MKQTGQTPCSFWAEKLAATHLDDLSPFERLALETHIASCPACAAVRVEYEAMGRYIRQLPPVEALPGIPVRLLQLWQAQNRNLPSTSPVTDHEQAQQIPALNSSASLSVPSRLSARRSYQPVARVQALVAVLVVVVLVVGFLLLVASHQTGTGGKPTLTPHNWQIISSPDFGSAQNRLYGVAAVSINDAWAVGSYSNNHDFDDGQEALIERWDGSSWSVVKSPKPGLGNSILQGVAMVSNKNVWAVGYTFNSGDNAEQKVLIEHWDGSSWNISQNPGLGTGSELLAVTALSSTNVWAVGYSGEGTLIEHWNGSSWTVVSSPPNPGRTGNFLSAVTAISPNDIWAVGSFTNSKNGSGPSMTLIEHWDGSAWSVVSSPDLGLVASSLSGITAVSRTDIWAVGNFDNDQTQRIEEHQAQTLIEHWDGTRWRVVKSPNPGIGGNELRGVVALSENDIWAVGDSPRSRFPGQESQTLIEHWNGVTWSAAKSVNYGTDSNYLFAITAVPHSGNTWAVGDVEFFGAAVPVSTPSVTATPNSFYTPVTARTLIESCCF